MGRTSRWRRAGPAIAAAALALATVGCSSTTDDPRTTGTSAVLGGSDGSASTSTSVQSNSEGGIPSNGGSISEQRPPMGES